MVQNGHVCFKPRVFHERGTLLLRRLLHDEEQRNLRASEFPAGNGYPQLCIGCAHTSALRLQSHVDNYRLLVQWQQLACAILAYDQCLQFCDPRNDVVAFLKKCAPLVYADYGKTISHFGGLRVTPHQAVEYTGWGKSKQLAWDRAYEKNGDLCYICCYDAGNSAYAGFVKVLISPEERQGLYHGLSSPH